MRFDWWTLGLQTVNFAVLAWLLHRFLYKPVMRMIDARKADIDQQYENAKVAEAKAKAYLAEAEAERAGIAEERAAVLKAAAVEAQEAAKSRRAEAEREASVMIEEARKTLALKRDKVLAEAKKSALNLGTEIARRMLAEVPTPFPIDKWIDPFRAEAWIKRIEHYLGALAKPELDALTEQLADGGSLTVVTASPLPLAIADAWRERLRRSLGDNAALTFEVNRDLIAGAELHFPAAVLRFSWASALAALQSEIEAHGDAR